jgi:hypothetical protein
MISPGEKHLKNLVQERGSMRIKDVKRHSLFHGWDPDSLRMVIDNLVRLGMLVNNGDVLSAPGESAARVASKFALAIEHREREAT